MQSGVSAMAAAMEQAVRRLETALDQREAAFRRLAEQHGAANAELKALREELQAMKDEAVSLRERASLVDALREELAQIQNERGEGDMRPVTTGSAGDSADLERTLAMREAEIAALKNERDALKGQLVSARAAQEMLQRVAASNGADRNDDDDGDPGNMAALKAELAAARASQAEMQAFQSGIAARLEATMARLRQALESDTAQ